MPIKRNLWLIALLMVMAAWPPPPAAAQERVLRVGYLYSRDSHLGTAVDAMATEIARRTNGRFRLEAYPNATVGGEAEMADDVQHGHLDMAFLTSGPFAGIIPETGVFDIAFLFRDANHARAVFDGPLGQDYLAKFRAKGMVALAWGENGMRHLTNSKRPINGPDDLKGLKLRVPQSDAMVADFRALGVDARPLAFPALYGALLSGEFDGQENPMSVIMASHFDRVQKYLTFSAHVYSWAVVIMSPTAWAALSESDRQIFVAAAKTAGAVSRQMASEAEKKGADAMRKQGIDVVASVDRAAFEKALTTATAELEQRYGKDLVDRIRQTQP